MSAATTDWSRSRRIRAPSGGGSTGFPAFPDRAYVADLAASRHAPDRVYAVFNNHKEGDFAPYLLRSDDRGRSW
ncbi:MAG: hypothetical protein V3T83_02690, partial [Acidobacteriota bacterium]